MTTNNTTTTKKTTTKKTTTKAKRVALYLRVSTHNGQTTENQRRDLEEVALRSGWDIVEVFEDAGISGTKRRDKRPGLDALLKSAARREIDLVAAWSVSRSRGGDAWEDTDRGLVAG